MPANSSHGDIQQYEIFVIYHGKRDPENNHNKTATNLSSKPLEGSWQETTIPAQHLPITYKDRNLTESLDGDRLEIVIGENRRPLRAGSFYQIFLRAYSTVRFSTCYYPCFAYFPAALFQLLIFP